MRAAERTRARAERPKKLPPTQLSHSLFFFFSLRWLYPPPRGVTVSGLGEGGACCWAMYLPLVVANVPSPGAGAGAASWASQVLLLLADGARSTCCWVRAATEHRYRRRTLGNAHWAAHTGHGVLSRSQGTCTCSLDCLLPRTLHLLRSSSGSGLPRRHHGCRFCVNIKFARRAI